MNNEADNTVPTRMYKTKQTVTEIFDKPYKSKSKKSEYGDVDMLSKLPDGTNLSIMFNHEGDDEWSVEFYRDNSQEVTNQGDALRIFATVINAIQKFVKKHKPAVVKFTASREVMQGQNSQSRAKLYDRLVQRYANAWGYDVYQEDHGVGVVYELTRLDTDLAENTSQLSYFGNCTDDDVIEHIFGDATRFAQAVDEYGDEFTIDDLVVKYDPETDIHSFYYKNNAVTENTADNVMSTDDMIAYISAHDGRTLHQDYLDDLNTFSQFVLKNISLDTLWTELPMLDRAKVEQYKKMDFSKAPPIVVGDGYILDGYHRATVAKALGMKSIKAYVGVKRVTENTADGLISGKEMLNIFKRMHHEHGFNKQMERWIAKQTWSLDTIEPEQLQDMYNDDEDTDPFDRTVWLDDAAVTKYERILSAGHLVNPIIMGPNRTVIDGNHRAQAAKNLHVSIPGYVPVTGSVDEAFNKPYDLPKRWHRGWDSAHWKQVTLPGSNNVLKIQIDWEPTDKIAIWNFWVGEDQSITGGGDAFRIFATAIAALKQFVNTKKPNIITFLGNDQDPSRIKMYNKLVPWLIEKGGLSTYTNITDDKDWWPDSLFWFFDERYSTNGKIYVLAKTNWLHTELGMYDELDENFADGKHPEDKGDSRRHGIPKHATLAQLDKISHQGGRKGQLAHWQANMRRGRAKTNESDAAADSYMPLNMSQLKELLSIVHNEQEDIDDKSIYNHSKEYEQQYRALVAIEYVIKNNIKALSNPALQPGSIFVYDWEYDDEIGAVQLQVNGTDAELKWLGSYNSSGKQLMQQGLAHAKAMGAKTVNLTSKWGSAEYYKKQGFTPVDDVKDNPITDVGASFKKDIEEAIAPHGDSWNELNLMKLGEKPIALVGYHEFENLYKPIMRKYNWVWTQLVGPQRYIIGQEGQQANIFRMRDLVIQMNRNLKNGIKPDADYHIEMGRLLGYSDADIAEFLKKINL